MKKFAAAAAAAVALEESLQSYTFPLTPSPFDKLIDSLLDELSGIVDRLDIAVDNGRTVETEVDLNRAYSIIEEMRTTDIPKPTN